MARKIPISILRTTRAALDANATAGNLLAGEPYLITDEGRLAIGLSTTTYADTPKKSTGLIGDGSSTVITYTHNLNTYYIASPTIYDEATKTGVLVDWVANGVNTVQLTFAVAPTTNQYRVTVLG